MINGKEIVRREGRHFGEIIKTDWPLMDTQDVPSGATAVPILIDDNGTGYEGHMIAGHFAYDGNDTTPAKSRLVHCCW